MFGIKYIACEYDLRGRKTYDGGATYPVRYEYDTFGNKISMTTYRAEPLGRPAPWPPQGDVTRWLYDEASGLVTNKIYADGMGPSYDYSADGRLVSRTWARGIVTTYAYDGWGNLTNTVYSDSTPAISVRYDAMGRKSALFTPAGDIGFGYCPWNGKLSVITNVNDTTTSYAYDVMDRVTNITWSAADCLRIGGFSYVKYGAKGYKAIKGGRYARTGYATGSEAAKAAAEHGWKDTGRRSHGQKVYTDGRVHILEMLIPIVVVHGNDMTDREIG